MQYLHIFSPEKYKNVLEYVPDLTAGPRFFVLLQPRCEVDLASANTRAGHGRHYALGIL